jgi:hypothetical protein
VKYAASFTRDAADMVPSPEKSASSARPEQKIILFFSQHGLFSMLFSAPTLNLWA